jgi:hypothetical protein
MPGLTTTAEKLLENYLFQKDLALEKAKVDLTNRSQPDMRKARMVWGEAMEKMAAIVDHLSMDPALVMEAVFSYARSMRHYDGPQKNMLGSESYILKAMGHHLELPLGAVRERASKSFILRKLDQDAALNMASIHRQLREMTGSESVSGKTGAQALAMLVSFPVVYRFAMGVLNPDAVRALAPEVLDVIRADRRQAMWLASKGWSFADIADYYNRLKIK